MEAGSLYGQVVVSLRRRLDHIDETGDRAALDHYGATGQVRLSVSYGRVETPVGKVREEVAVYTAVPSDQDAGPAIAASRDGGGRGRRRPAGAAPANRRWGSPRDARLPEPVDVRAVAAWKPTWSPRVTGCSRSIGLRAQSSHSTSWASAWLGSTPKTVRWRAAFACCLQRSSPPRWFG